MGTLASQKITLFEYCDSCLDGKKQACMCVCFREKAAQGASLGVLRASDYAMSVEMDVDTEGRLTGGQSTESFLGH